MTPTTTSNAYAVLIERLSLEGFSAKQDVHKLSLEDIAVVLTEFADDDLLGQSLVENPHVYATLVSILGQKDRQALDRCTFAGSILLTAIKDQAYERLRLDVQAHIEREEEIQWSDRDHQALDCGDYGEEPEQALGMGRSFR